MRVEPMSGTLAGGRYQLQGILGTGGMATVYRVWDDHLAVHRAVKVLSPELADKPAIRARFIAEARAMARIRHRHVVAIQDVFDSERGICIVMELIPGGTAWERVRDKGRWPEGQAVQLLAPIADAVAAAHEAGIVHRDIKPQNILLTTAGEGRLADFGIARLDDVLDRRAETRTGTVMGTWGFMPPEQRNDASRVETRSDIYALGATLWAMVTGKIPTDLFMADREPEMMAGISPELAHIIERSTRYRPTDRYSSAEELAAALRDIAPVLEVELPDPFVPSDNPDAPLESSGTLVNFLDEQYQDVLNTIADVSNEPTDEVQPVDLTLQPGGPAVIREDEAAKAPAQWISRPLLAILVTIAMMVVLLFVGIQLGTRIVSESASSVWAPLPPPATASAPAPTVSPPTAAPPAVAPPETPTEPTPETPTEPPAPGSDAPPPSTAPVGSATRPSPRPAATDPVENPTVDPLPPDPPVGSGAPPEIPMGTVIVAGGVSEVWLQNDDGQQFEPGTVPAGHYILYARFVTNGAKVPAADIHVAADDTVNLTCNATFLKCGPKK